MVFWLVAGCAPQNGESAEGKGIESWVLDLDSVHQDFDFGTEVGTLFGYRVEVGKTQNTVWDHAFTTSLTGAGGAGVLQLPDGSLIDPTGPDGSERYLNLQPAQSQELHQVLQDGDIVVFMDPHGDPLSQRVLTTTVHSNIRDEFRQVQVLADYAPAYVSGKLPFHVLRIKATPDTRTAVQNWALIAEHPAVYSDPFVSTPSLEVVRDIAETIVEQRYEIPLSSSAFAHLAANLGMNYPQNQEGLGALWETFSDSTYGPADQSTAYSLEDLMVPDAPLMNQMVFDGQTMSEFFNAWMAVYFGFLPTDVQQALVTNEEFQAQLIQPWIRAFGDSMIEPEWITLWASAYGQSAGDTERWLMDNPKVGDRIGKQDVGSMTPMDILVALEEAFFENRLLPDSLWLQEANRLGSNVEYVATFVECSWLTPADGTEGTACLVQ